MAVKSKSSEGILGKDQTDQREHVVELLTKAYWMEIETVMSYIAGSVNPDGVRAREIMESLEGDIQEELGHAQQFAERIKELYGVVPGLARLQRRADVPAAARASRRTSSTSSAA